MTENNQPIHIVVIGGGFAGVAATINLILATQQALRITVVDPGDQLGLGVAYRTTLPEHRLNGITSNIGIILGKPEDFVQWLLRTGQSLDWLDPDTPLAEGSAPRMLYGKYIQETLQDVLLSHADRVEFSHVQAIAVDVKMQGSDAYEVILQSGDSLPCNYVVVATGVHHKNPASLGFGVDELTLQSPAFISDQWHSNAWKGVESDQTLVILGAGLSSLDAIISAEHNGFKGKYVIVSRKGLPINPREWLDPCEDFLEYDVEDVRLRPIVRQVQIKRRELAARGRPWQSIVAAIRKHVPALWRGACTAERRRYLRKIRPFWDSALHRSAKAPLRTLESLRELGRVQHVAASIESIQTCGQGAFLVNIRAPGECATYGIRADRVISCLGLEFDWHKLDDPLIVNMVRRGLAVPDVLGLGVQADPQSCRLLDKDGTPWRGLYAMGHPLRGIFWESNAVTEHLPHASLLVASIVAAIGEQLETEGNQECSQSTSTQSVQES